MVVFSDFVCGNIGSYKNTVKKGKTDSSRLAEHVWREQHKIVWDEIVIVQKKIKARQYKFKLASFIATHITHN